MIWKTTTKFMTGALLAAVWTCVSSTKAEADFALRISNGTQTATFNYGPQQNTAQTVTLSSVDSNDQLLSNLFPQFSTLNVVLTTAQDGSGGYLIQSVKSVTYERSNGGGAPFDLTFEATNLYTQPTSSGTFTSNLEFTMTNGNAQPVLFSYLANTTTPFTQSGPPLLDSHEQSANLSTVSTNVTGLGSPYQITTRVFIADINPNERATVLSSAQVIQSQNSPLSAPAPASAMLVIAALPLAGLCALARRRFHHGAPPPPPSAVA